MCKFYNEQFIVMHIRYIWVNISRFYNLLIELIIPSSKSNEKLNKIGQNHEKNEEFIFDLSQTQYPTVDISICHLKTFKHLIIFDTSLNATVCSLTSHLNVQQNHSVKQNGRIERVTIPQIKTRRKWFRSEIFTNDKIT